MESKTLYDIFNEKTCLANKDYSISKFLFGYEGKTYLVEWRKGQKWSNPEEITYI